MSFYTSLSGLKNAQTGLSVTANNIANAETLGFKKSRTLFSDLVVGTNPKSQMGIGSTVQSISQNFGMGPIEQTGGSLDMAINGDGFFSVKNPLTGDVSFTRNGAFSVDDSGFIKDGNDNRLQIFPATAPTPPAPNTPIDAHRSCVPTVEPSPAAIAPWTRSGATSCASRVASTAAPNRRTLIRSWRNCSAKRTASFCIKSR